MSVLSVYYLHISPMRLSIGGLVAAPAAIWASLGRKERITEALIGVCKDRRSGKEKVVYIHVC